MRVIVSEPSMMEIVSRFNHAPSLKSLTSDVYNSALLHEVSNSWEALIRSSLIYASTVETHTMCDDPDLWLPVGRRSGFEIAMD
jgi:hypothetical protein